MIVYEIKHLFGGMKRSCKMRTSDKNKRKYNKRYRRWWFWEESRWNARHGI